METSGSTHRWVAGRGDARACANAVFAGALRQARLWVFLGVLVVGLALYLHATGVRLGSALLLSGLWMPVAMAAFLALRYVAARRRLGRQLPPGLVLESEFGPDFVVLRGPLTESRIQFVGIEWVRRRGDWVLLRQSRSRALSCWPIALFPTAELARIQGVTPGHPS
jgi:hypothetical protein